MPEESSGNPLKVNFTEKIGPFPIIVWAGLIVALGLGIYYFQKKKTAAAAPATASGTSASPDPNAVDPSTGMSYAQENAEGYNIEGTGYGAYGSGIVTPGGAPFGSYGNGYSNIQQWENAVYNYLTGLGNDPLTVENTLSGYVNGGFGSLTPQQQSLLDEGLAWAGQPPGGSPVNVPPGQGTGGSNQTVTIGDYAGQPAGEVHNELTALGLKPTAPPGQQPNAKVSRTAPGKGTTVVTGTPVAIFTSGYVAGKSKHGGK